MGEKFTSNLLCLCRIRTRRLCLYLCLSISVSLSLSLSLYSCSLKRIYRMHVYSSSLFLASGCIRTGATSCCYHGYPHKSPFIVMCVCVCVHCAVIKRGPPTTHTSCLVNVLPHSRPLQGLGRNSKQFGSS